MAEHQIPETGKQSSLPTIYLGLNLSEKSPFTAESGRGFRVLVMQPVLVTLTKVWHIHNEN